MKAQARQARGVTLVELLVVLAMIGILLALALPLLAEARKSARRTTCAVLLRDIGLVLHSYGDLYNNGYAVPAILPIPVIEPETARWPYSVFPNSAEMPRYVCPETPDEELSYMLNHWLSTRVKLSGGNPHGYAASEIALAVENGIGTNHSWTYPFDVPVYRVRRHDAILTLYLDGHVAGMPGDFVYAGAMPFEW